MKISGIFEIHLNKPINTVNMRVILIIIWSNFYAFSNAWRSEHCWNTRTKCTMKTVGSLIPTERRWRKKIQTCVYESASERQQTQYDIQRHRIHWVRSTHSFTHSLFRFKCILRSMPSKEDKQTSKNNKIKRSKCARARLPRAHNIFIWTHIHMAHHSSGHQ